MLVASTLNKLFSELFIRSFDSATVAGALGVTQKDMRNFLQRSKLRHQLKGRQGVTGKFSVTAIVALELALQLHRVGLDAERSYEVAELILSGGGSFSARNVTIAANMAELELSVRERLGQAAEFVVRRRRGRPPRPRP